MNCEQFIDAKQVAEILKIHPNTVKRMAAAGDLPGFKFGKLWRFRESMVDEWVEQKLNSFRRPCPKGKQ